MQAQEKALPSLTGPGIKLTLLSVAVGPSTGLVAAAAAIVVANTPSFKTTKSSYFYTCHSVKSFWPGECSVFNVHYTVPVCVTDTNCEDVLPSDLPCGASTTCSVFRISCRMSCLAHTLCICVSSETSSWAQPTRPMAHFTTLACTLCLSVSTVSYLDISLITRLRSSGHMSE